MNIMLVTALRAAETLAAYHRQRAAYFRSSLKTGAASRW
jgi:hypothetical protein